MPRIAFDTFEVQVPTGWLDITDEVEADDPPFTLARTKGVGALQFSIALYMGGELPNPTAASLRKFVEEFGRARGLGQPRGLVAEAGPPKLAAGSFQLGEDFVRVWQLSDG